MNHPAVQQSPAVVVIGPQFCAGHPVDLTIVRKMLTLSEGNFGVTDVNGNIMHVQSQRQTFQPPRATSPARFCWKSHRHFPAKGYRKRSCIIYAGHSNSVIAQLMSWRGRWQVFRGESTDKKDLIFSVRKSSLLQLRLKMKLEVYLASNTREDVCDFIIEGSWFKSLCVIYAGRSRNIVAQMHRNQSVLLGKDSFRVTVYPNVDYAFVVALVLLLEEINMDWKYYSSRS